MAETSSAKSTHLCGATPVRSPVKSTSMSAWIRRARDGNGNGILEFGSSDVGQGLYLGTKLAAKDESFMDNSPIHDEAQWNESSRTLDCEDVGLNCLVCLDSEMLGLMARELGGDATAHETHAAGSKYDGHITALHQFLGTLKGDIRHPTDRAFGSTRCASGLVHDLGNASDASNRRRMRADDNRAARLQ